ncbi:MAG: CocE/NonD family hydrolase [Gemmatimonadetes bacterium]|nr:CocE/NonD family hydrolase [Gemmatimonadota bacterium]
MVGSVVMTAVVLAAFAQAGPIAPPAARYQVRLDRSHPVPMRDGVKLSTDLYWPVGAGGKLPTVLMRTPYNKNSYHGRAGSFAQIFASQGFLVAIQDTRGRFESEGSFVVQGRDEEDGHDTVEWIAAQEWSNGKIGTYGCSYGGDTQIMMARARPRHLAAQIPQAAGSSVGPIGGRYHNFGTYFGGAWELAAAAGWFWGNGSRHYWRPPPQMTRAEYLEAVRYYDPERKLPEFDMAKWIWHLPTRDILRAAGAPASDYEDLIARSPADPWWDQFGYLRDGDRFDVPALHINSWYDFGAQDTFVEFNAYRAGAVSDQARDHQYVIMSPVTHCRSESVSEKTMVGQLDFGDARFDYWGSYLQWYDRWLNGNTAALASWPRIRIFVMGRNAWRSEDEWPLARTKWTPYYLRSGGRANSRDGDGALSPVAPKAEPADRFSFDPATPVWTVGGSVCAACARGQRVFDGPADQAEVEVRNDVLVYTSPTLTDGVEVTGPIKAVLYVSSSAKDTDFTVKLVDVHPDGRAFNVQEGIQRMRFREGYQKKVWIEPGQVYKVEIDLEATSMYFKAGHRIRVQVSSSNFPRWDRNLGTGGNNYDETTWVLQHNTVHHSARYPSHLLLPVIP